MKRNRKKLNLQNIVWKEGRYDALRNLSEAIDLYFDVAQYFMLKLEHGD